MAKSALLPYCLRLFLPAALSFLFLGRKRGNAFARVHFDAAQKLAEIFVSRPRERATRMLSAGIACCRIKRSRFHGRSIKRSTVERTRCPDPMGPNVMSVQSPTRPSSLPHFICIARILHVCTYCGCAAARLRSFSCYVHERYAIRTLRYSRVPRCIVKFPPRHNPRM